MRELTIDGRRIADDEPAWVIAEIGSNHGGDVATACAMIRSAAECGAEAVKFQKRENIRLYIQSILDQMYENENSYGKTYGEHRAALEFGAVQYGACQHQAMRSRVTCFATAFDEASADFLMTMGAPAIKIASGGLTDEPLLQHVAALNVPVILSTGGGTMREIHRAVDLFHRRANVNLAILHCTAAYPVRDYRELNLRCLLTLREAFPDHVIGWSGHDSGIAMSIAAYAMGARIIEKHFTLKRDMKGTDHAFSLEPVGLTKLCRDLARAHEALGDGLKRYYPSELAPIAKMRRRPTADGWIITGEQDSEGIYAHPSNWVQLEPESGGLPTTR